MDTSKMRLQARYLREIFRPGMGMRKMMTGKGAG